MAEHLQGPGLRKTRKIICEWFACFRLFAWCLYAYRSASLACLFTWSRFSFLRFAIKLRLFAAQNDFYLNGWHQLTMCESFCNSVLQACKTAKLKGKIFKQSVYVSFLWQLWGYLFSHARTKHSQKCFPSHPPMSSV